MALELNLILALLIHSLHADQGTYFLKAKGDICAFTITDKPNYCLVSRSLSEGNMLLWNSSSPSPESSTAPSDLRGRMEVMQWRYGEPPSYVLRNVTESDGGLYTVECWTDNKVSHLDSVTVTVCDVETRRLHGGVRPGDTVELRCEGRGEGHNFKVQWFKSSRYYRENATIQNAYWLPIFLKDGGSVNPLLKHLEGRVQLAEEGWSLHISNFNSEDLYTYTCVVMNGQSCVSKQLTMVMFKPEFITQW